jgi:hypothetical protein
VGAASFTAEGAMHDDHNRLCRLIAWPAGIEAPELETKTLLDGEKPVLTVICGYRVVPAEKG